MTLLDDDSTDSAARRFLDQPGPRHLVVGNSAGRSRQGRQRHRNEDIALQLGSVFVVADGMGGLPHSHQVVKVAAETFAKTWLESDDPNFALQRANDALRAATPEGSRAGCTLSAIRVARDQAVVVHVGDSRVYRCRAGDVELLTRDHNIRSELLAAGIAPQRAAAAGPLGALTSYLGIAQDQLRADVRSVNLRDRDRLVLCTDGVFGQLPHADLAAIIAGGDVTTCADRLTANVGRDDATCVVLDIERSGS